MKISFSCSCGQRFSVNEKNAGRKSKCPKCSRSIQVPRLSKSGPKSILGSTGENPVKERTESLAEMGSGKYRETKRELPVMSVPEEKLIGIDEIVLYSTEEQECSQKNTRPRVPSSVQNSVAISAIVGVLGLGFFVFLVAGYVSVFNRPVKVSISSSTYSHLLNNLLIIGHITLAFLFFILVFVGGVGAYLGKRFGRNCSLGAASISFVLGAVQLIPTIFYLSFTNQISAVPNFGFVAFSAISFLLFSVYGFLTFRFLSRPEAISHMSS